MGWDYEYRGYWPNTTVANFRRGKPICGQRRWSGSHVACVCLADHEGPHESAEGDQWEDE